MSNYRYSADLIDDALFRAGEPTDGTSEFDAKALAYCNRAYQALWQGGAELDPTVNEDWFWLLSTTPGTITLEPVITAGTVNVANNSAAITFSSGPASSVAGWFFKTDNNSDIFRIASHTAASTSATLDSVYTAANAATAGYTLFKHEYSLTSGILHLIAPMRVYRHNRKRIGGISLLSLENKWPLDQVRTGVPYDFALVGSSTVRFSHCGMPDAADYIRVDYDYLKKPADLTDSTTEEPLVPLERRKILSDFTTFFLMVDKNDNRADGVAMLAKGGLQAMAKENRSNWAKWATGGNEIGHISPRQDDLPQNMYPIRTESGLIVG